MCDTMTMDASIRRKRMRSDDSDGCSVLQRKTFVHQHMMDRRDAHVMQQVKAKTINLLFQGAKNHSKSLADGAGHHKEFLNSVRLLGGGEIDYDLNATSSWVGKKADRKCRLCDRMSIVHANCTNCNLELCEHCGVNCNYCPVKICMNCVNLFDCESHGLPCCEQCKMFV